MGPSVVYSDHVRLVHNGIMMHTVLFVCLGVVDCYPQPPHGTHGIQHDFVAPELFVQQMMTVTLVAQRTFVYGSLALQPIVPLQCSVLVEPDALAVVYQPHDHLLPKVPCRVERVVLCVTLPYSQSLFDGGKQTITISFNLSKIRRKSGMIEATGKVTTKIHTKHSKVTDQ